MTVRRLLLAKEILWGSETAADTEARAKEVAMIYLNRANDPAVGNNVLPRVRGQGQVQPQAVPRTGQPARP